ncbi:MAG TPA: hypothetical protein DCS23_01470, partial [Candidatus Yonathbacteria bacterium]|nr:hypothetical protein [Candidatus Yonathbacteria bacterium]
PGGNVLAPINTGGTAQTKTGALTTGGLNVSMADNYYIGVSITGENFSAGDTATRLRIQDKTGGISWFLSANNDGSFAIHQGSVGDRIAVNKTSGNVTVSDVCTTDGKCLSTAGGSLNASLGPAYWYHPGCGYGGPCNCPGNSVMVGTYGWWTTYTDAYYLCRNILN